MKKSQRLRYHALMSKGDQLTSDEQAELQALQALVAQHSDASQDEDDSDDSAAEGEDSHDDDDDDHDDGEGGEGSSAAATGEPGRRQTSLGRMLAGIFASAKAGKGSAASLAAANQRIAKLEAGLKQARADLAAGKASLQATSGHLAAALSIVGLKPSALTGKTSGEAAAAIKAAFTAALTEELGTLGFPSVQLPAPTSGEGSGSKADLIKRFAAITDPKERAEFYAKHSAKMFAE